MTVRELIAILQEFDPDLEVEITDGWRCLGWSGDFSIDLWERDDGQTVVDIGIGGLEGD